MASMVSFGVQHADFSALFVPFLRFRLFAFVVETFVVTSTFPFNIIGAKTDITGIRHHRNHDIVNPVIMVINVGQIP